MAPGLVQYPFEMTARTVGLRVPVEVDIVSHSLDLTAALTIQPCARRQRHRCRIPPSTARAASLHVLLCRIRPRVRSATDLRPRLSSRAYTSRTRTAPIETFELQEVVAPTWRVCAGGAPASQCETPVVSRVRQSSRLSLLFSLSP
jgi:hypothetical protein